jgi:bifunctional UDP-N-acetylglucosamine pyrophosphorylase/glucosamine-1-phosphate N-acetyltransferase
MNDLVAIILAAGQGTRMYSGLPKVLHSVAGQPMIDHVLEAIQPLGPKKIYVVTGFMASNVQEHVGKRAICVKQDKRLGTAHAVKQVLPFIENFTGDVLVTVGDAPLIKTETLRELVKRRRAHQVAATVLTTELESPTGYGRIVRSRDGTVRKIVEEKDTNTYEVAIQEVNTGIYVYDCQKMIAALRKVGNKNAQREYYLTDTIEILGRFGDEVEPVVAEDSSETMGINSRAELARAESYLRNRIAQQVMEQGVTVIDPATTYIDKQVRLGRDTVIRPFTIIQGKCTIGERCDIGPNAHVIDSAIGDDCVVKFASIEKAKVGVNVSVGPYSSVRPQTTIADGTRIGTFVEVTRSDIGADSDILHLTYIGDAKIGDRSSVGAGSLTVNFDGQKHQKSVVGDDVFLGSRSSLVAPLHIDNGQKFPANETLTGRIKASFDSTTQADSGPVKKRSAAKKTAASKSKAKK